jgi:hypothetical protein
MRSVKPQDKSQGRDKEIGAEWDRHLGAARERRRLAGKKALKKETEDV